MNFDPRTKSPSSSLTKQKDSFVRQVQSLPQPTMWGKLLGFSYEDYDLMPERRGVLLTLCENFREGLASNLEQVCNLLIYLIT
jgi:hypothetical protein